jgi:aspartate/glutamate racemase
MLNEVFRKNKGMLASGIHSSMRKVALVGAASSCITMALYQKLMAQARKHANAYPHVIISDLSGVGIRQELDGEGRDEILDRAVTEVILLGAEIVVITGAEQGCQRRFSDLIQRDHVEILLPGDEIARQCLTRKLQTVGMMVASVDRDAYPQTFANHEIVALEPLPIQQIAIDNVTQDVLDMNGRVTESACKLVEHIAASLLNRGAQAIVLGSPMLSTIFERDGEVPYFCATSMLADSLMRAVFRRTSC